MSIGAELARARQRAGLTVRDVSVQTRIRETIIRGIERDDYSACGGDFYARGDIRSIARAIGTDPEPLIREYDATQRAEEEITAAEAFQPTTPIRVREPRGVNWTAVLAVAVLAVAGFAAYHFIFGSGHGRAAAAPRPGVTQHPARSDTPRLSPTPSPSPPRPAAAARRLLPVSAAAFGPGGTSRGDDPQLASLAIDGSPATAWHTAWYATARFGNLKSGTGLLLDLGHEATITSAVVTLGRAGGTNVQLRTGSTPALSDLRPVARVTDAAGRTRLRPAAPVRARFVLIWFTRLPPDSTGTFQASVYDVRLEGRP